MKWVKSKKSLKVKLGSSKMRRTVFLSEKPVYCDWAIRKRKVLLVKRWKSRWRKKTTSIWYHYMELSQWELMVSFPSFLRTSKRKKAGGSKVRNGVRIRRPVQPYSSSRTASGGLGMRKCSLRTCRRVKGQLTNSRLRMSRESGRIRSLRRLTIKLIGKDRRKSSWD